MFCDKIVYSTILSSTNAAPSLSFRGTGRRSDWRAVAGHHVATSSGRGNLIKSIAILGTALAATTLIASAAQAAAIQFNVVQASSSLTINGTVANGPLSQQTPGSLSTSYTGTVNADLTGNVITFTGGSSIDAVSQAVNQQPGANGLPGSAPADYGFSASLGLFGTAFVAARGVNFDVTSGGLTVTAGAIAGGTTLTFNNADVDYNANVTFGREELDGTTGANAAVGATLVTVGNLQTLTIPISAIYNASLVTSGDTTLNVAGTIVATRTIVPEPTTLTLLGGALMAMVRRRRG